MTAAFADRATPRHPEMAARMYELAVGFKHLFAVVASGVGVHPTDLEALRRLHSGGSPPAIQELGADLHLSSAAVTGVVDRLERAGHARRVPDAHDRRRTRVAATERSAEAVMGALEPFIERLDEVLDDFDDDSRREIGRFVARVVDVLPK